MSTRVRAKSRDRRTVVPGQFLGFSVQELRFLDHLIRARGETVVCLEVLGDVASIGPGGEVLSEESKSRTSRQNPLADRAVDFWKTLRNWVEAAVRGELDVAQTIFCLHVSHPVPPGPIAEQFHGAHTEEEARAALEWAAQQVEREGGVQVAAGVREHIREFYAAPVDIRTGIVVGLQIEFGSGDSVADLRRTAKDAGKWVSDQKLDDILCYLLGWIKERIVAQLESRQPAKISGADFNRVAAQIARQFDRETILLSRAKEPSEDRKAQEMTRTYVRQMDLIDLEYDAKLRAINEYLRAEYDRHEWGIRGEVHASSFDAFEQDLISTWHNVKIRHGVLYGAHAEVDRGKLLFADCCGHRTKLNGVDPPAHFCPGSFHLLSDRTVVGWHPRYEELLSPR
jgi:hypothetical protein